MSAIVRPADEMPRIRWMKWPGRIAVAKPPCSGAAGCKGSSSSWQRCACGLVFAACGDHQRDLAAERATHEATCTVAGASARNRDQRGMFVR